MTVLNGYVASRAVMVRALAESHQLSMPFGVPLVPSPRMKAMSSLALIARTMRSTMSLSTFATANRMRLLEIGTSAASFFAVRVSMPVPGCEAVASTFSPMYDAVALLLTRGTSATPLTIGQMVGPSLRTITLGTSSSMIWYSELVRCTGSHGEELS